MTLEVLPVTGMPEVGEGADLAALILDALGPDALRTGDVVAVTQKAVSKAEGRMVPAPDGKASWVDRETVRVVARRDDMVIAETRHGLVCASAGVDESNVPAGMVTLLPQDPDASAARIREAFRTRAGVEVGVIVTDTFGRPWRRGLVDVAIGSAGLPAVLDLRGTPDALGRPLEVTVIALADQVAAAAGLVMSKAESVPAAVVRGIMADGAHGTASELVRPPEEDLFRFGPLEALSARRTVREFGPGTVPREALLRSVAAALTAPVPHGSRHPAKPWAWVLLESQPARRRYLDAMAGTASTRRPSSGGWRARRRSWAGLRYWQSPTSAWTEPTGTPTSGGPSPSGRCSCWPPGRAFRTSWWRWRPRASARLGCPPACSARRRPETPSASRRAGSRWGQWRPDRCPAKLRRASRWIHHRTSMCDRSQSRYS
jgi:coenzyme F420-0:L-glutamate ligase